MSQEKIVLAGGCFWGVEELIRKIPGVIDTEVGYAGGKTESPTYQTVKTGSTGHAEAVQITFDPTQVSLETLLKDHFFKLHDPTTKNRQGNDVGTQYRSAIFYNSPRQKEISEKVIREIESSGIWKNPVVTELIADGEFYPAEDYHQDYLQKNPHGYTCHFYR